MEKIYKIKLRISTAATISPLFFAVQGDKNTRKIEASIFNDDGSVFQNESGIVAEYWSKKPDGHGTAHSASISSASGTSGYFKVTATLQEQDLAADGKVYAAIVLKKSGNILAAMPFYFQVLPIPIGTDVPSESDYELIAEATAAAESAATSANSAASAANSAASAADTAAGSVNTAISAAQTATSAANSAASSANSAAQSANTAAGAANTAAGAANTAAGAADTATGSANSAASAANTAANAANAAAVHGPQIRDTDQHWMVWDPTTQAYIDTEVPANGVAGSVLYSAVQALTDAQKQQARSNIGAATATDVGNLSNLDTTAQTNLVAAINEVVEDIENLCIATYDSTDESIVFRSPEVATYDSTDESIIINV